MTEELIERVFKSLREENGIDFAQTGTSTAQTIQMTVRHTLAALEPGDEIGDDLTVVKTYSHRSVQDMKKMGEEEMRERCAKLADEAGPADCSYLAIAIRALK